MASAWYVYILKCADGSLYTGVARDLQRRLQQHNGELAGGSRYTRGRRPVALLWSDSAPDRGAAQRREAFIKKLSRDEKLHLMQHRTAGVNRDVVGEHPAARAECHNNVKKL